MLAFPSTYSVGITSLGYQVVWATLAQRPDVDVRRLFTDQGDPPHGGQRGRGPDLDLFGLSLSWELDGPVLLDLLEQQRIPIWAVERGDGDPIVFGGGPVLTANPEPLAPFFDAVLLGDGELLLPAFIDALQDCRTAPRPERLRRLAAVPGVYVPSLYAPRYDAEGQLLAVEPIKAGIPAVVEKQTWRGNTLTQSTVITPEAAWPSIHMVEVVRSCPELCRFCLASYLNLPFRTASLDDGLIPAVENSVSGNAFRPLDVVPTRKGITVEIGNTDAEGRLILCDALHEGASDKPTLMIDCATLTGAARVALGTDLPAMFCNNDALADQLLAAGRKVTDPMWRLPLFKGYRRLLDSKVADINNAPGVAFGGAITAALYLQEFVPDDVPWAHFDMMAWNNASRPGRPEGGEAQAARAIFAAIEQRVEP